MTPTLIWGREPAAWSALLQMIIMLVSGFMFSLSVDQQGSLNAAVTGGLALLTAYMLHETGDALIAIIMGVVKAIMAIALSFGWGLAADKQTLLMSGATIFLGFILRGQVTAPVSKVELTNGSSSGKSPTVNKLLLVIMVALLPVSTLFTGCTSTGDIGADAQGFWNSAAVQSELSMLESEAMSWLNAFITSNIGAAKTSTKAEDFAYAKLRAKHPHTPEAVLRGVIAKAATSG